MADLNALKESFNTGTVLPAAGRKDPTLSGFFDATKELFRTQDYKFDYSGIPNADLRATLSRMDNDAERANYLNRVVGPNGWTTTEFNEYALTPEGMNAIGLGQSKIPTVIDEPGLTRYDFADMAGSAPSIIGGTGAGIAASGVGFIPGILLAGLGAAGGKAFGELYDEYQGLNLQGPGEVASDIGSEGAIGATGEGVYRGILSPVARFALGPEARRMTPQSRALVDEAVSIGARPNPTQVTKAPILGRLQSMMNNVFGDPVAKQNSIALRKELVRLRMSAGPKTTSAQTGEQVAKDISRARKALSRWSSRLYEKIDEAVDYQPVVPTSSLKAKANEILESLPKTKEVLDAEGNVIKESVPAMTSKETLSFLKDIANLEDTVTLTQATRIRNTLYDGIQDNTLIPGISSHDASLLFKAARKGFDDAVESGTLPPDVAGTLKTVNSRYGREITKFDDAFIQRITANPSMAGKIEPSQIVNAAFKKGGSTKLERLFKVINEGTKEKVRRIAMEELLSKSISRTEDPLVSLFTGKKFLDALDSYGRDTLVKMFGSQTVNRLYKYGRVTSFVNQKMKFSGGIVAASLALHPWQNLGKMVRLNLFSRFLNTDAGLKWMTEGFDAQKTRKVGSWITRGATQMMALGEQNTKADEQQKKDE